MSPTTTGRIVGVLILVAYGVYLTGGALADGAAGVPAILSDVSQHRMALTGGALLMLTNSAAVIAIGVLMVPILRRRHEVSAMAYLGTRLFEGIVMAIGVLGLLLMIPVAQAADSLGSSDTLSVLARTAQNGNTQALHIAMIALGVGSLPMIRALLIERWVPRWLAVLGLVGYPVLALGEALLLAGVEIGMFHYAPGGVFEVVLALVLIIRGFPARGAGPGAESPTARPHQGSTTMPRS